MVGRRLSFREGLFSGAMILDTHILTLKALNRTRCYPGRKRPEMILQVYITQRIKIKPSSGLMNHWFPLVRPAIKPLFLDQVSFDHHFGPGWLLAFSTEPTGLGKWCVDNECHATVESTWTTGGGSNLEDHPGTCTIFIFFIFTPIWGNDPIWRAYFFRWVETTK